MENFYLAYGLKIQSDLALPELERIAAQGEADLRFEWSDGPPEERRDPSQEWFQLGLERAEVAFPGVGWFRLEAGRRVQVEPAPGVTEATVRALLLGPVLATVLYQRRFLVLHCSAVALRGRAGNWGAVGFLGHSGDGKSTMAAALDARGARVMSDDVIAVPIPEIEVPFEPHVARGSAAQPGLRPIHPTAAQLRLWPSAVEALGENPEALPLLYPQQERRVRRVEAGFEAAGAPLRALFVLGSGGELEVRRLSPAAALFALVEHTYCAGLRDPVAAASQFQKCGVLARSLPVFALHRPRDLARLGEVAASVETAWQALDAEIGPLRWMILKVGARASSLHHLTLTLPQMRPCAHAPMRPGRLEARAPTFEMLKSAPDINPPQRGRSLKAT